MKYSDEQYLLAVVLPLVDFPDDVSVERRVDEMGVLLSLRLNQLDNGKVIGRGGETARAIRHLVHVVGIKNSSRVSLKIEDPPGWLPAKEKDSV